MSNKISYSKLEDPDVIQQKRRTNHSESNGSGCDAKLVAFVVVGVLTLFYVIAELASAIYLQSLVLLSDGFHNLSDVISLYIAYWARQAAKRESSDEMSYGWARTEILGGLTNGCFLLSLVLYVMLESIPKFIEPVEIKSGLLFIVISASGLAINTFGTIAFALTGQAHAHSHAGGGGHSHDGGHGHSHDHKDKKKKKKEKHELEITDSSNGRNNIRSSGSDSSDNGDNVLIMIDEPKEKKKKEGHGHSHDHKEEKKEKGHGHSHDHKEKKKKPKRDENVHAVFLHFLGDAISSLMVLTAGILLYFFKGGKWTAYIDPVSSLIVCGLILYTTIPLVKRCSLILLQSTGDVPVSLLRKKLMKLEGLINLHDLHVWQLVDGMTVASVHVALEEGVDFNHLVSEIKKVFHEFGVHSSCIQPEFVARNVNSTYCNQNCVVECEEDWCCKQTAEKTKKFIKEFSVNTQI